MIVVNMYEYLHYDLTYIYNYVIFYLQQPIDSIITSTSRMKFILRMIPEKCTYSYLPSLLGLEGNKIKGAPLRSQVSDGKTKNEELEEF